MPLSFRMSFLPCSSLPGAPVPVAEPGSWGADQKGRWDGDKGPGGLCWDMALVALFTRAFFWLSVSKPPGNALSVSSLNTNQATLPTHTVCQTCQLPRGRGQLASDVAYCYRGSVLFLPSTALHLPWWEQWAPRCLPSARFGRKIPSWRGLSNDRLNKAGSSGLTETTGGPVFAGSLFQNLGGSSRTLMISRACLTPGVLAGDSHCDFAKGLSPACRRA